MKARTNQLANPPADTTARFQSKHLHFLIEHSDFYFYLRNKRYFLDEISTHEVEHATSITKNKIYTISNVLFLKMCDLVTFMSCHMYASTPCTSMLTTIGKNIINKRSNFLTKSVYCLRKTGAVKFGKITYSFYK